MLSLYSEYKKLHTHSPGAKLDNADMRSCQRATTEVLVLQTGKVVWRADELQLLWSCGNPACERLQHTIASLCAFIDLMNDNTVGLDFVKLL